MSYPSITEVSHETSREVTGGDLLLGLVTCGISLIGGASGDISSHTVTLRDDGGSEASGTAPTYDQACANAREALRCKVKEE